MTHPNPDLLARILEFDIDGGPAEFPFERKLADKQGWTIAFARRAILEYRRFVYMAMVFDHMVSPSSAVDEAWHLHLLYTRSYWDRFMAVLPRKLHHEPSRGGNAETAKLVDLYGMTLQSYRELFDEEPSTDLWPRPVSASASESGVSRRSGKARRLSRRTAMIVAFLCITVIVAGCGPQLALLGSLAALWLLCPIFIVGLFIWAMVRAVRRGPRYGPGPQQCQASCNAANVIAPLIIEETIIDAVAPQCNAQPQCNAPQCSSQAPDTGANNCNASACSSGSGCNSSSCSSSGCSSS